MGYGTVVKCGNGIWVEAECFVVMLYCLFKSPTLECSVAILLHANPLVTGQEA
jgi:hypothetical protein